MSRDIILQIGDEIPCEYKFSPTLIIAGVFVIQNVRFKSLDTELIEVYIGVFKPDDSGSKTLTDSESTLNPDIKYSAAYNIVQFVAKSDNERLEISEFSKYAPFSRKIRKKPKKTS